jgi:hypothetical protein
VSGFGCVSQAYDVRELCSICSAIRLRSYIAKVHAILRPDQSARFWSFHHPDPIRIQDQTRPTVQYSALPRNLWIRRTAKLIQSFIISGSPNSPQLAR